MARHSSGTRPGVLVTALTVVALGVVAFFAYQASAGDDRPLAGPPTPESAAPSGDGDTDGEKGGGGTDGRDDPGSGEPALPPESGTGKRVVYSVEQSRVWLVDIALDGTGEEVRDTYEVFPSSVDPPPGEYEITSRIPEGTGSDGVQIEHTMVFHVASDGVVFGFSSAVDGSTPDPDSDIRTGGIRQSRSDGADMWLFAVQGTAVVVVP
ncbi:hypothetical protein [Streptomyces sp. 6N223]|uniref:hypothetical protein n=1 Tax=Streptomyces sp. 6N223 TaxID=3457412 RepID=UPI003FCF99F3